MHACVHARKRACHVRCMGGGVAPSLGELTTTATKDWSLDTATPLAYHRPLTSTVAVWVAGSYLSRRPVLAPCGAVQCAHSNARAGRVALHCSCLHLAIVGTGLPEESGMPDADMSKGDQSYMCNAVCVLALWVM